METEQQMAVLHFFLVNSTLTYILFSLVFQVEIKKLPLKKSIFINLKNKNSEVKNIFGG